MDSLRLRSEHNGSNELSPIPLIFKAYQHLKHTHQAYMAKDRYTGCKKRNIQYVLINLYASHTLIIGLFALIRSTVTKKPKRTMKICNVLESLKIPSAAGVSNDVTSIGTVEFIFIDIYKGGLSS